MKQFILISTLLIANTLLPMNAMAASTEVTWKDYKNYFDVAEGSYTRSGFEELVTKRIGEHFTKLATELPEDHTLQIEVTDVDLAGHVKVASMNSIRIIKSSYPPRMNFSYKLLDASGAVIKSDDVVVRDLGYLSPSLPIKYRNVIFGYEKKMLDDWFKETFSEIIVK